MDDMTELTIQIDTTLKNKAEIIFQESGLSISNAIQKFMEKCVNDGKIAIDTDDDPDFDVLYSHEEEALLYHPKNVAEILQAAKSLDEGKGIKKTVAELRALIK